MYHNIPFFFLDALVHLKQKCQHVYCQSLGVLSVRTWYSATQERNIIMQMILYMTIRPSKVTMKNMLPQMQIQYLTIRAITMLPRTCMRSCSPPSSDSSSSVKAVLHFSVQQIIFVSGFSFLMNEQRHIFFFFKILWAHPRSPVTLLISVKSLYHKFSNAVMC